MDSKEVIKKEYYSARKENVKEQVPCDEVLKHFDVDLLYNDMEVQYRCPLHGDGRDRKKSARYYPESDDTYCWGCQKYRDQIGLVMDFKGCSFTEALSYLERHWNIDNVPNIYDFSDPDSDVEDKYKTSLENELDEIFEDKSPEENIFKSIERKIERFKSEHKDHLDALQVVKMYHTYDHLMFRLENDQMPREKAHQIARKLSKKIDKLRKDVEKD